MDFIPTIVFHIDWLGVGDVSGIGRQQCETEIEESRQQQQDTAPSESINPEVDDSKVI